jgi:hypothetical protein
MTSIQGVASMPEKSNGLEYEKLDTLDTLDTKIVINSTHILELDTTKKRGKKRLNKKLP